MPRSGGRSSGGRSAPSGSRGSHSMAGQRSAPPTQPANVAPHKPQVPAQQQPAAQSQGIFGQIATTAAGVAAGHGLSNMLFGGSGGGSSEPAPEAQSSSNAPAQWNDQGFNNQSRSGGASCEIQSKDFLRCLDATNNNMDSCAYYLDQLKACQAAARPY